MTKHSNITRLPVQPPSDFNGEIPLLLSAQHIGCLLGCIDSIIKMGYAGSNHMLMAETIEKVEVQVEDFTRSMNTIS
jgi:hypothetical protein